MFIGNQKIIQSLEQSLGKGKIAQAYIFSGPEGVGKFFLARQLAHALIKGDSFILAGESINNDPDLVILFPEVEEKKGVKKEKLIPVEKLREMVYVLASFPYAGQRKVLIINEAEKLSSNAQNALLKSLEEPNSTSVIILVTKDTSQIISTIQSRCQRINFRLTGEEEIARGLSLADPDLGREVAALSLGRPGVAIELSRSPELLEERRQFKVLLDKALRSGAGEKIKLAESLAKDVPQAITMLECWLGMIYFQIENKKDYSTSQIARIKKIEDSLALLRQTNSSPRLIIENLLLWP